jgi:hypothetical protein
MAHYRFQRQFEGDVVCFEVREEESEEEREDALRVLFGVHYKRYDEEFSQNHQNL